MTIPGVATYFVTVFVQNGLRLFGYVVEGEIILNDAGRMIAKWYHQLPAKFHTWECRDYIVIPNHFHAIFSKAPYKDRISIESCSAEPMCLPILDENTPSEHQTDHFYIPNYADDISFPTIMQWFKTMTTNEYIRNVRDHNWESFHGKLW